MFGAQPPQALYHTRQLPSPSCPNDSSRSAGASPRSPSDLSPHRDAMRNRNQSAYTKKKKSRRDEVLLTAYSDRSLVPSDAQSYRDSLRFVNPNDDDDDRSSWHSVYTHYQHSLNSLHDIIQRVSEQVLQFLNLTIWANGFRMMWNR